MVTNITNTREEIATGNDNIVIVDVFQTVRGGKSLDVTGFKNKVINGGHVLIKESSTGNYKPMPLNNEGTAYAALPSGHEYAGVLISTIKTERAFAAIMVRGTVNTLAAPYPMTDILQAVKTALPLIDFRKD